MSTYRMSEVKAKSKSVAPENDTLGREAFLEILHNVASSNATAELKIAIVGVTNVGKSAFVNSLVGKSALPVYNPTGPKTAAGHSTTPYPQSIILSHKKRKFTLIDTPGLSFIPQAPSTAEEIDQRVARDLLLRNRGNISKIKDPLPAALYILSRASMEDLLMLYNLPAVSSGDYDGFLASLARKEGALQKRGAVVDFQGAARALVRDWKTGRLAFYTFPPRDKSEEVYPTSQVPTKVEISTTYQKHDEKLLGELLSRKELRRTKGTIVQLKGATLDRRRVDLEANAGLSDKGDRDNDDEDEDKEDDEEEEEEEEDEEDEEEEERGDTPSEDDDDGDDSEEMENAPILSGKQKRVAQRHQKPAEKKPVAKKTVSFAAYTKAGAKIKASKNARVIEKKPSPVQRQAPRAGGKKSMTNKQNSDDPDAYDFSKYF
ncbi:hypothetical protein FRC17_004318 [Serendipita sp. 399]|nr:hypothetical protein FRC17_004318 [Serendipita sp. 399]